MKRDILKIDEDYAMGAACVFQTAMIDISKVDTITVMMMEVPCCGGLMQMVSAALANASRKVPVKKMIVGINGEVLQEEWV